MINALRMLRELWSSRLFGHDIRNILACLDVHNSNDAILYTFLQKSNFDCYMFTVSCVKSFPVVTAIAAVLSTHTHVLLIIDMCC